MDQKPDLRKIFGLYSAVMGIGFGAVGLGLWYHNSKEQEVISEPPAVIITEPVEEGVSPQP